MQAAIGLFVMISCTIAANIMMKIGANSADSGWALFGTYNWKSIFGLALFGFAGVTYAWVLKLIPLHVAQIFFSIQFVGVIAASALILSEPIPLVRWAGIVLIAAGIALAGFGGALAANR